jgi:hypothetical protein
MLSEIESFQEEIFHNFILSLVIFLSYHIYRFSIIMIFAVFNITTCNLPKHENVVIRF